MIQAHTHRRRLGCRAVGRLLQPYLDGEVPEISALLIADHLDGCRRCGLEADAYRLLLSSLARLAPPQDREQVARLRSFADELVTSA